MSHNPPARPPEGGTIQAASGATKPGSYVRFKSSHRISTCRSRTGLTNPTITPSRYFAVPAQVEPLDLPGVEPG